MNFSNSKNSLNCDIYVLFVQNPLLNKKKPKPQFFCPFLLLILEDIRTIYLRGKANTNYEMGYDGNPFNIH